MATVADEVPCHPLRFAGEIGTQTLLQSSTINNHLWALASDFRRLPTRLQ